MPDATNDSQQNDAAHAGCHGFGLRANNPQSAGKWIDRFEEWLADKFQTEPRF